MQRRRIYILVVAAFCWLLASLAHAQLPQVSSGLSYLASTQNPDSTWDSATTAVDSATATGTVLETLKLLNQTAGTPYTSGTAWLQGQSPQAVALIAQRIWVLGLADPAEPVNAADSVKGGWGGFDGYETNPLDTALALQALKSTNYPDLSVSNASLAYFTNTQNPDGGWSFNPGDPSTGSGQAESSVFLTTIVAATLQQFPQTTTIANAITKATVYLTTWQNPDGGFGTAPAGGQTSTVYETALAYAALLAVSTDATVLGNALNYLTTTQSANGSWNDDPYSTALALKALYLSENKPTPPSPAATTGSVMATIVDAATNAPLAGVSAVLTADPSFTATTNASGLFALAGIPSGGQQIRLTYPGYAPLTITASISAGTFINVGKVGLSATPTTGIVQGVVWDGEENAPYPGVQVQVTSNSGIFQSIAAADGSYRFTDVGPGTVTAETPAGPKPGYYNAPFTGVLAPGGILVYNPVMSKTAPMFVNIAVQPGKTFYKKGDAVALTVTLRNTRATAYSLPMVVQVTDPSGTSVYGTSVVVELAAYGTVVKELGFTLPEEAQGGFYKVMAEVFFAPEVKRGEGSTIFSLVSCQVAVTPKLPDAFSAGANTATFDLVNTGPNPVTAGGLEVNLKDPGGEVVSAAAHPFTLGLGENKTLTSAVSIPALKFGTYTLSYTQSNEMTPGQTETVALPNTVTISPLFDKAAYRIRETANLLVSLNNTGRFRLDVVTVTVVAPDAGYADTRTVAIGPGQALPLQFAITLPETLAAGQHSATVTISLPGGSTQSGSATFTVQEAELSFGSLSSESYSAGDTVRIPLGNIGGKDTGFDYTVDLYDARYTKIAIASGASTISAGASVFLELPIPAGVTSGSYYVQSGAHETGGEKTVYDFKGITVQGVEVTLTATTSKEWYLATEPVQGTTAITLTNGEVANATLNVKVLAAGPGQYGLKWWDSTWKYRQSVVINSGNFERENHPVSLDLNFTDEFTKTATAGTFDENSLRVIEYDADGNVLREVPSQLDKAADYDAATGAKGSVYWIMDGVTPSGSVRRYAVYFDTLENVAKAVPGYAPVPSTLDNTNRTWRTDGVYMKWGGYGYLSEYYSSEIVTDLKFDKNANDDPADDLDLIGDQWCLARYTAYGFLGSDGPLPPKGFGSSTGIISKRGPVFVEFTLGEARFRYYKGSKTWVEASGTVDFLWNFGKVYDYVKAGNMSERYISDPNGSWTTYYNSTVQPGYIAYRMSSQNLIFGAVAKGVANFISSNKESDGYDRVLYFDSAAPIPTAKIYWYSDGTGGYGKITNFSNRILNEVTFVPSATETYSGGSAELVVWESNIPANITHSTDIATQINLQGSVSGKFYVQSTLISNLKQVMAQDVRPFYVVGASTLLKLTTDKEAYKPGETVTVAGEVRNLSPADITNVILTVKTKPESGAEQMISSSTFDLPAMGSYPFTITTTTGAEGFVDLTGIVTRNGSNLAKVVNRYDVASPQMTATLTAPDQVNSDPFTVRLELRNSGSIVATAGVRVTDDGGNLIYEQQVTLSPGESRLLEYARRISVSAVYTAVITGDLNLTLTKGVACSSSDATSGIDARTVTDRASYYANEQVTIISTVTNQGTETISENLSAWITVLNSRGETLYSDTVALPQLVPVQLMSIKKYWNTANHPAGTYVVRLVVSDGAATATTAEATFQILGSTGSGAGLTGTIAPSMNPVTFGEDEILTYSVANTGNEDLAGLTLSVTIVDPDTQAIMQANSKEVNILQQGTLADSLVVPTAPLAPRAYVAVLQARTGAMAEPRTLAAATFTVRSPGPPTLLISTLPDGSITNNAVLNIAGTAASEVGIAKVAVNDTAVTVDADGTFSHALALAEGRNTVTTVATDTTGNTTTDTRQITLDQTAPLLNVTLPADNSMAGNPLIEVKGSVDESATVEVKVSENVQYAGMDGTAFNATVVAKSGFNTIEVTARDLAGNPSTQKRTVLYDDQKPSLAVTEPGQDIRSNKSSLTISGTSSDPYTAVGVIVSMDGTIMTPPVVNGIFSQLVVFGEEKLYPITVTAANEVGTQTSVLRNVIYDKTPPTLTIDPVVTTTNASSQMVAGTREEGTALAVTCATAAVGAVEYPTPTSWRAPLTSLQQGENLLQAEATDLAGNRTTATATILYVPKAPDITIGASPNQLWPPNKKLVPVTLSGNVVTYGSDIRDMAISVADEYGKYTLQGLKFGATVLLEAWRDGNDPDGRVYTVTAVVTDQAGNVTTKSATVIVPHDMGK